jgi:hypothetical protein
MSEIVLLNKHQKQQLVTELIFSCKKCRAEIADTSISPTVLRQEIWNHFYSFHKEDMDATQVFSDYLSTEE